MEYVKERHKTITSQEKLTSQEKQYGEQPTSH